MAGVVFVVLVPWVWAVILYVTNGKDAWRFMVLITQIITVLIRPLSALLCL